MLSDFENIAKQPGGWENNFIPAMQEKGFDSMLYTHDSHRPGNKPNAFMVFDPKQVMPRFSPEGQELIKERGIKEPLKKLYGEPGEPEKWVMPRGILKPYDELAPVEPLRSEIFAKHKAAEEARAGNAKKLIDLSKQYYNREITIHDYVKEFDNVYGKGEYEKRYPGMPPPAFWGR